MTTILYDGKNLHADRRIVHDCFPTRISNDGVKLYTNEENTIAIGCCGILPDTKKKEQLFTIVDFLFRKMYSSTFVYRGELKDLLPITIAKDLSTSETLDFIAITYNKAFLCRASYVFPQTGFLSALGTGEKGIIACYYVLQDVATAFRVSSELDTLSSPEYMSIMADTLNPYVVE